MRRLSFVGDLHLPRRRPPAGHTASMSGRVTLNPRVRLRWPRAHFEAPRVGDLRAHRTRISRTGRSSGRGPKESSERFVPTINGHRAFVSVRRPGLIDNAGRRILKLDGRLVDPDRCPTSAKAFAEVSASARRARSWAGGRPRRSRGPHRVHSFQQQQHEVVRFDNFGYQMARFRAVAPVDTINGTF
jgi:hypothetical protein